MAVNIQQQNLVVDEVSDLVVTDIVQDAIVGDYVRDIRIMKDSATMLVQLRLRSVTRANLEITVPPNQF